MPQRGISLVLGLLCLLLFGCGPETSHTVKYDDPAPQESAQEPPPDAPEEELSQFEPAEYRAGDIFIYALEIIENFSTDTHVNFSLYYKIQSTGATPADVGFNLYGVNAEGLEVFRREITAGIDPGTEAYISVSFGEPLTFEEYDSISFWQIDDISIVW